MRSVIVLLSLSFLAAAPLDEAQWKTRGSEVLRPFKETLQAELKASMQKGPTEAIAVCREVAPELARKASSDFVAVGRSSHKLRNPANAPRPWVKPLIDAYAADPAMREPRVVDLGEGRVGYVEPIVIQPVCLVCHGETTAPAVQKKLQELYPDDAATGFHNGDFRGVFWIEFTGQ